MKEKKALTKITIFLISMGLTVWLIGMYCLTSVTAEFAANRYLGLHWDRASR